MSHPPVLTPERIDGMISGVAEVCFAAVQEAGQRLHAAPDMGDFERAGRTLNGACRNLRQTIAMKQRHDREQAAMAAEQRRDAEAERNDAARARDAALWSHRTRVRRHFERVLWDEYEDDDAQEMFEDIEERLGDLADDAAFLDTPVETLITSLAEEVGFGAKAEAPAVSPSGGTRREAPQGRVADGGSDDDSPPAERAARDTPPTGHSAEPVLGPAEGRTRGPSGRFPPEGETTDPPAAAPPEPEPPPRPPDPPPEPPYIQPWDRIPPGRRPPGSFNWMG